MEGENMGGWWPEHSTPDTDGLRSVVEELELERNQLQEQILSLEERCQDLEDRLQLQARVETLQVTFDVDEDEQPFWVSQNELEKLQSQLASVRHQQSRDAEKHQLLVTSLNEQLQGLSDMQESLESSLVEKENTLAKTSEKLELVSSLRESLSLKETQFKEVSDKLLQTEQSLENISQKCSGSEKQCGELKSEVADLTQKLSLLKEKTQKQEVTIDTLQTEVDQTNEELDKLNTAYLEERAQLIHDLQSCEREIDSLKDVLLEKDKEISVLSGNISEYTEQLIALKQDLKMKEDNLIQVENALSKAEREVSILRESQNSDQRTLESKITELMENLKDTEMELLKARDLRDSKTAEVETLVKQADDDKKAIQELRGEIQKQLQSHCHHLSECEMHIASLKEQLMSSAQKLQEALELQQQFSNKEQSFEKELKSSKDEQNRLCSQVEKYRNEMHVVSQQLEEQTRTEDIIRGEMKEKSKSYLKNEKKQLQENLEALTGEFEMQKQNVHQLKEQVTSALDSNASYQNQVSQNSTVIEALQKDKEELTLQNMPKNKEELNVTNETIKSLTEQIGVLEGNARELESDAELRRGEVVKLQSHIQAATEENHQLRAACESKEKELAHHSQVLLDLNGQLEKALEQNSSFSATVNILTENNQRLQEELAQKEKAVSELNADKSSLQELLSGLEKKISEDRQAIDRLLKEKEELATAADGFKKVLQESEQSNSAGLLQKTNECEALSKVLKEKEGWLQNLREEADGLKKQVAELTEMFTQKEQTALEQRSQLEDKQNELLQLHDAIRVLQEQESVLRSGIMEKDALIQQGAEERQVYQREISREKSVVSQLQAELETVRGDCAEAKLQLQQREEEFQMSRDELNKQTQSVVLLSSQLGEANERAREMEVRVQKLADEHRLLTRELEQRNAEATDLTDDAQALKEQSAAFKSELQKTVTALARSQEEVTRLKTECSGLERLQGILQEKDEALRQKDTLCKNIDLEDSVCRLRDQVDSSGLEVSTLQHSLKQKEELSLEWQSQSAAADQTLGTNLQAKEVECSSLKEKVFHLEESVEKLNNTLQAQTSEVEDLKRVLGQKDVALSDQFKCLQDVQRRADEALLFKTQFTESAELVSQLQSQLHSLSTDSEHLKKSAEETQSAFNNLREKYAANLEELQDARRQLSQRMDEVSGLQKLLDDSARQRERASSTTETLRSELSAVCQKLEEAEDLNAKLSKEKDEALVSHQANVSLLTVEIEKLKSQYLQVATQLNVLTENLEQREMALHAINSQYSLQNKNTSQLVSEMQKLEEVNQRLKEEIALSKEENRKLLTAVSCENAHLKEEFSKSLAEKKELENRCHQMRLQMEEECSSLKEMMERVTSERDGIQTKVSVQDQELCQLKENLQKVEQVLQDSEREWLFVLDREKQEKNLLVEQLKSVENEMKSKDIKVDALKQDLDGLQEKLALASSAIRQGSDQLSAKELEASVSRVQLEKVLASVQEKEFENSRLKEALNAAQHQLHTLLQKRGFSICAPGERSPALSDEQVSLQNMITRLEASHQGEVDTLNSDLNQTVAHLKRTEQMLHEGERCSDEKDHQTALLQTKVEQLQSQLSAEVERAKDAAVTLSCLNSELREKGDQIGRMNIQISQQLLLLADLSQQLLDKDASIAQVMESAANERIKTREENSAVVGQLQSLEQEHATSAKRFEEISQQLHEQLSRLQAELEAATSQKSDLIQEKDALTSQLVTATKEKDATKRKLQAALLVRKELLRKVEQYEAQTEENAEVLRLQEQLKEAADQARAAAERHEQHISDLRKGNLETEGQITEQKAQSERLQSEKQLLESTLNEKEQRLSQTLQTLTEKSFLLEQLQAGAAEKDAAAEQERKDWMQKLEQLQKEIQNASSTASAAVEEAEKELAQVTHEKTKLEKKVHAALLARKETTKKAHEREKKLTQELTELKEEYQALLEQQRQQTNDLNALQFNFEKKVKEVEELNKTSLSDQDELASLKQLMQERDKSLQDLKKTMGEREIQSQSLPNLQMELENLKSQIGKMYEELASKDEALTVGEQGAEALKSKLLTAEKHLEEAQAEIKEKTDQAEERRDALKAFELRVQQEKHVLISEKDALESRLNLLESALQHHTETAAALEEARLQCAEKQRSLDVLKREQAEATALISELKDEISSANKKLAEFAKDKTCAVCKTRRDDQDGPCFSCQRHENLQIKLKEREEEELIAALELQLQQQIGAHEASMERVKTEAAELQRSQHNGTVNDQDNQSKIAALTRKLQAALLSRKELIKENSALKQDIKRQADKERAKELEFSSLEAALEEIKRQNMELESSASSASRDKDRLRGEVDQLLSDNHSLSAACDSLKLTIENITQQKEAFSCQLESLKDSQTDELSKWKSKHAELKQEYESLLQSYENISSEMEKMRQVLEATKRDRQEAIKKAHHLEAERDVLEKQVAKLEEEQEGIKEKMRKFSKEKLCKVEELEEENRNTRRELTELTENHRTEVSELTDRNRQLEAEICKLKASSEELDEKLSELHSENKEMAAKLEEATYTLEKASTESKTYTSSVQLKLDEALGLSNSLTAQMETQTSELGAQMEVNNSLQKEKQSLCQQLEKMQNDHELQLGKKDVVIQELRDVISGHSQETVSLNEKVRILEDDKSLLQEELENVQEISDKVKNENEYLETVALRNSEKIDELTESIALLQAQKMELSSQLAATKDMNNQVRQEKEEEQLRLVREFEGKLKTVQRGNDGSKNVNKELQELLKEKHQEINQLQQNCIRYQEVILELESSSKSSQAVAEELKRELKKSSEELSALQQKCGRAEAELSVQRDLLQQAKEKLLSVESERDQMASHVSQSSRRPDNQVLQETQPVQKTDSHVHKEFVFQQQIEELILSKDGESKKVDELKRQLDSKDGEMNALKRAMKTNEAKLSALSSSPGGAEASSLWNHLYQKALNEKDNQLLEQGFVIKRFLEDMRVKDKEMNDLRVTHLKLERTINEYSVAAAAQQRQLFVLSADNAELSESAELMAAQVKDLSDHVERLEEDKNVQNRQLSDGEDAVSRMQLKLQHTEKINADAEAQLLLLRSQNDRLQADSERLEGITVHLKTLLQSKDAEIASLLSCRDGQMSGYIQQLQANHRSQAAAYEDRLASLGHRREAAVKELRRLEAKLRHLQVQVDRSSQEREHG
ncbi:centromere protein F-like, partial [Takifugu rubripes]|uniref:centromere protein F-like n=1 Tax=Takifugu rubripes TaxID=31033 RepID=UPI0011454AED